MAAVNGLIRLLPPIRDKRGFFSPPKPKRPNFVKIVHLPEVPHPKRLTNRKKVRRRRLGAQIDKMRYRRLGSGLFPGRPLDSQILTDMVVGLKLDYAPVLKVPSGASSNRIIHLSVCSFLRNSVTLINKVRYLKFG